MLKIGAFELRQIFIILLGILFLGFPFSSYSDTIKGTDNNEVIDGTDSNDQIFGLNGNDVLKGFDGADTIMGGEGHDRIFGGKESDMLFGDEGSDHLSGDAGDDIIDGGEGDDFLVYKTDPSGVTVNFIQSLSADGYGGVDTFKNIEGVFGSPYNDTFIVGLEKVAIFAGEGNDYIYGGASNNGTLDGGSGNDHIFGEDGDDSSLIGNDGNDHIEGGKGNDRMDGGQGNDFLKGGPGSDKYIFNANDGKDRISDSSGRNDCIIMGPSILRSEVSLKRYKKKNLLIKFIQNPSDAILVLSHFTRRGRIECIEFANGEKINFKK